MLSKKEHSRLTVFFRLVGCLACFFLFVGCLAGLFYERAA